MITRQSRVTDRDVEEIAAGRHRDPFAVLGPHAETEGWALRVFAPGAQKLTAKLSGGDALELEPRGDAGFFEGFVAARPVSYRLRAENQGGAWEWDDPYQFGPILGPMDDHLLVEGAHHQLYARLGAHKIIHEGVEGVHFSVWAPNAMRVSVVGGFNHWNGRQHPMRKRIDSGLWEIFIPGIGEGEFYKFEILSSAGQVMP